MNRLLERLRARQSPEKGGGVEIRVRAHNRAEAPQAGRRRGVLPGAAPVPRPLLIGLALAATLYVLAHLAIMQGVWPIHGAAPGAGALMVRDLVALAAWLAMLFALRMLGFRGNWAVVILPVIIFSVARPDVFSVFTDPAYQARAGARVEANTSKAERSRISTIERAYTPERQELVFGGDAPAMPDPFRDTAGRRGTRGLLVRAASQFSVWVAPAALLLAFLWARKPAALRLLRERKRLPFAVTLSLFFILTLFFTELGKVRGTTPWELFLPVFILTWAATLADDSYNLAIPGAVVAPRRILGMLVYGALPVVPFLIIRELGLSIVLAGSLAIMLLVGTRRGWWAGLMLGVWAVLVLAAFNLDERSATRLSLAYHPYRDTAGMTAGETERWAAKLHQIKLFDANILEGGLLGAGPGRGHAETAPNAADDGFITLVAAQWGWLGTLSLVLLYTVFLVQMMTVAIGERGAFERTAVTGLALLIGIPFWLATLGGMRIVPLTGVAAAFAAHGGAKLLASAIAVGIVAGISHRRGAEQRRENAGEVPAVPGGLEGVRVR